MSESLRKKKIRKIVDDTIDDLEEIDPSSDRKASLFTLNKGED